MERQKCSECRHRIIKAPDMGGNHARGCRINHLHWREHDYRNRECFLPEPYCYAPEMAEEIEKLKAEMSHIVNRHILKVSAVYFPKAGVVEATWENTDGECVDITFDVTEEEGDMIAKIVTPCVYEDAIVDGSKDDPCPDYPVDFSKGVTKGDD